MAAVTAAIGDRVQIIGDDVLVTNAERVARAGEAAVCNAALTKVNQVGTVTEAKAAFDAAVARGWGAIVSARSGESGRSEEHTSELQSLMRSSYAVFCLKQKRQQLNQDQR